LALWTRFACAPGGNSERAWQAASFGQIRPLPQDCEDPQLPTLAGSLGQSRN
jgi:hypothetical protein